MRDCTNADIKKDLEFCMNKWMEGKKKQAEEVKRAAEEAKNAPKISEVKKDAKEFQKIIIEDDSADSDDEEALKKIKAQVKGKTKMIDEETLK